MEDRLKKFAALIDAGSFTQAARDLHVSQPALSAAMTKLERQLKVRLIVRGSRPLTPTPAGQLAYDSSKALDVVTDNLTLRLSELQHADITLAVGMIDSVADILFESDDLLQPEEGRVQLSIVVNNSRYLLHALECGTLDAAYVVERHTGRSATLEFTQLADDPLVLICQPAMADAATKALQAGVPLDFIAYDPLSSTAKLVNDALAEQGVLLKPVFSSTSPEVMLRLALLGRGVGVVPYLLARPLLEAGQLRLLDHNGPVVVGRSISLVKRRNKELPAILTRTTHHLQHKLELLMREAAASAFLPK